MAKKKKLNWVAIKKRYLLGERPRVIAEDYDLTAKQISDKASYDGWVRKKTEVFEKIVDEIEDDLQALCNVTLRVHRRFMENLEGQIKDITNPYLFDGEKTNSLFQTAMNNATKLTQAVLKSRDGDESDDNESPGGLIGGVDPGSI